MGVYGSVVGELVTAAAAAAMEWHMCEQFRYQGANTVAS